MFAMVQAILPAIRAKEAEFVLFAKEKESYQLMAMDLVEAGKLNVGSAKARVNAQPAMEPIKYLATSVAVQV